MSARTWVAIAAALAVALPLVPAGAQLPSGGRTTGTTRAPAVSERMPRRILYTGLGALVGAAASSVYLLGGGANRNGGACATGACVVPVSTVTSAFVGYLVGREKDQLHAIRYRGGRPLSPGVVSIPVEGEPTVLVATDTTVVVAGLGGVQLFGGRDRLRATGRRAAGVRGIGAVAVAPQSGSLAIGAASGLYVYPPNTGPGTLVRDGDVGAAAAAGDRVYYAVGTRVERAPFDADTTRNWPGIELGHRVSSLTYDGSRSLLWAVADSAIYALRPEGDSLALVSTTTFDAAARRADIDGTRLAVAFGDGGVRTYDASDPTSLRERARWTGARFVYDVSFAGTRLFAASGIEGVYVLDADSSPLTVLGLARELGFAIEIESRGEYTYILDRSGTAALRRIKSDF